MTDCSGRTFYDISGFEYALWAKDKHMWECMHDRVKQLPTDKRKKVAIELRSPYEKVKNLGITYSFYEQLYKESHFEFEDIINTLEREIDAQIARKAQGDSEDNSWHEIMQWQANAVTMQREFPMHIVYEYCSETSFLPTPDFITPPTKRNRDFNTYPGRKDWFTDHGAKVKGMMGGNLYSRCGEVHYEDLRIDLAGMKTLNKVRTEDLINLEVELDRLLQVDCQPTLGQG